MKLSKIFARGCIVIVVGGILFAKTETQTALTAVGCIATTGAALLSYMLEN